MRRVIESGVVLGALAALASLPLAANAAAGPEPRAETAQSAVPQFLPNAIPAAQTGR